LDLLPPPPTAPLLGAAPLLALDTSGLTARVALLSPAGDALATAARTGERHSAYLLPLCDELLRGQGLTAARLGAIACGRGPGSFTGLRVGMAVAKGLCLPFDLPLVLISSLEALALDLHRQAPEATLLVPCIDAGKGEVYAQSFTPAAGGVAALGPERRLVPAALAADLVAAVEADRGCRLVLAGGGFDRHHEALTDALPPGSTRSSVPGPSAEAIGELALARLARGERDDLAGAVPSYGRLPDITKSKRKIGQAPG
jgi:tRNA threonylcarbamoyladenosine biosynthesis protein TsaB